MAPCICAIPAHAGSDPYHLPRETPHSAADNANPFHQRRCDPSGAKLEDGADGSYDTNVERGVADRYEVGEHLSRKGEDSEVQQSQGE
jgi:hypothetical protein